MFENISVKNGLKLAYEGKAILYDIRDKESYIKGHLPTALHVEKEYIEETLKNIRNGKNRFLFVILYCEYGNQSMHVARELSEKGYDRIASMVGGYHAYEGYVEGKRKK